MTSPLLHKVANRLHEVIVNDELMRELELKEEIERKYAKAEMAEMLERKYLEEREKRLEEVNKNSLLENEIAELKALLKKRK